MRKNPFAAHRALPPALRAQLAEQRLPMAEWTRRCALSLRWLLPDWPARELEVRACALWVCADCMPPEEAAEIVAGWWRSNP